ncbi:unnamed protein product [Alternaria alternata]
MPLEVRPQAKPPLPPNQPALGENPYTAANQAKDELHRLLEEPLELKTDGTICLTQMQMVFFQHDDGYLWPSRIKLLHFAGSVSMKMNYGKGISRYLAEQLLPKLQELAGGSCTTPIADTDSLERYWGLRLVTYLGKNVKVTSGEASHSGVLKGAVSTGCSESTYKLRISAENEREVPLNLSDLANGTTTVQTVDGQT